LGLVEAAPAPTLGVEGDGDEDGAADEFFEWVHAPDEEAEVAAEVPAGVVFEFVDKGARGVLEEESGAAFLEGGVEIGAAWAAARAIDLAGKGPAAEGAMRGAGVDEVRLTGDAEVLEWADGDGAGAANAPAGEDDVEEGVAGGLQALFKDRGHGEDLTPNV